MEDILNTMTDVPGNIPGVWWTPNLITGDLGRLAFPDHIQEDGDGTFIESLDSSIQDRYSENQKVWIYLKNCLLSF